MNQRNRAICRAALWLYQLYVQRTNNDLSCAMSGLEVALQPYLEQAFRSEHLIQKAMGHGFLGAVRRLKPQYVRAQEDIITTLDRHLQQVRGNYPAPPSLRELAMELEACGDEFGDLEVSREEDRLSVVTDSIVLEGVGLGRFRIDVLPSRIPSESPMDWFKVESLEPNPPASTDDVPHPHVEGNHLCTGDGSVAVQAALISGRLSEFFRTDPVDPGDLQPLFRIREARGVGRDSVLRLRLHDQRRQRDLLRVL